MDRTTAKALREKLNNLFAEHGIEGFDIDVAKAVYDDTQVTIKVVIKDAGAPDEQEKELQKIAGLYDLDTSKIATDRGDKYSLVGFNKRARKQPFIIQKLGIGGSNNKYKI